MNLFRIAIATVLSLHATAFAEAPPIRIMPLGDSITEGASFDSPDGSGGYRGPLYTALTNAGYHVDYIGSQTANSSLVPDPDHEGHPAWRIDQLDANITGWLSNMADPDVVLLHIGTNDLAQNYDNANALNRLDALILKIANQRPFAHIIVTNLMEYTGTVETTAQTWFNSSDVQARVNAHAAAGCRVTFLDMRSAVPLADKPDSIHPNQTGYDKMAAAWLPAIQAVTGPNGDNAPPAIARTVGHRDRAHVAVTFSKPVADSAADPANFALSGGLTVSSASLDASKRVVTLTTSKQSPEVTNTITVNNVVDRSAGPLALPANSSANFTTASTSTTYSVPGFSFEDPVTTTYVSGNPTGWVGAGTQWGYQNAAFASITGATGSQVAFCNGQSSLWSAASVTTIALDETYTLTVDVTGRQPLPTTASRLRFIAGDPLSGGTIVAESVFNPADTNALTAYTLTYTPSPGDAGKGLFLMISNAASSGQSVFDKVRLTSNWTPERIYESWIATEFPNQTDPGIIGSAADPDHDGVPNLVEYALNGRSAMTPDGFPGTYANGVLSFSMRAGTTGLNCVIEESDDLGANDPWATATTWDGTATTLSQALLPADRGKRFARLKVTRP